MGDVILSTPVLTALKEKYPQVHITMLVRNYTRDLVVGHPHVDRVLVQEKLDSLSFWQRVAGIRQQQFDTAIVLHPRFRIALLLALAGIPLRIGSGYRWYSFLFNHRIFEHRKTAEHHELDYNLRMLRILGIGTPQKIHFYFDIPETDARKVELLLQHHGIRQGEQIIVVHPGSGGSARDWPPEHFAALIDRMAQLPGTRVIITGSNNESELVEKILNKTHTQPINLVGNLSIKQLASLIKASHLFIANSTGPLHLAVAVGTNVVSFYCPIIPCLPDRWGPYNRLEDSVLMPPVDKRCNRCSGEKCEYFDCMNLISVNMAYQMVIDKISKTGNEEGNL